MLYYKAFCFWLLCFSQIITHVLEIEETNECITFVGRSIIKSMENTCLELAWLRYILQNLKVELHKPTLSFCDNQATYILQLIQFFTNVQNTLRMIVI